MAEKATTTEKKAPKAVKKAPKSKASTFAVIATGGKQYVVSEGDSLKIEKLDGVFAEGDKITFDNVMLTSTGESTVIGEPSIAGAKVEALLEKIGRHAKVTVIKYKQKSRYFKKNGHRQPFFQVKVTSIK